MGFQLKNLARKDAAERRAIREHAERIKSDTIAKA
jgi:hypothetical protein